MLEISPVSVYETSHSLSHRARRIFKSDVLRVEIGTINVTGRRARCAHLLSQPVEFIGIIIVGYNCTLLPDQRNIDFAFGNHQFLFVNPFSDQNGSAYTFAEIGNGINSLLYGKEVAATVFRHYIVIVTNIPGQRRNFFGYGLHSQFGNHPRTVYI